MRKILAPHAEQDGWVYWRVYVRPAKPHNMKEPTRSAVRLVKFDGDRLIECPPKALENAGTKFGYRDDIGGSRIISSRRVERAVETDDFLRLCAEEGLFVRYDAAVTSLCWHVYDEHFGYGDGETIREAYYRYHAAVGDAS